MEQVVGVQVLDELAPAFDEAPVACGGHAAVLLGDVADAKVWTSSAREALHDLARAVGRAVVDDDKFDGPVCLGEDGPECLADQVRPVEGRDDDRDHTRLELDWHRPRPVTRASGRNDDRLV